MSPKTGRNPPESAYYNDSIHADLTTPQKIGHQQGKSRHNNPQLKYCEKSGLEVLFKEVSFSGKYYIIDADMANYFGSIDHGQLRGFLDQRIKDGVIRRMIDKWLKAGVLEAGRIQYPEEGTPQGGVISPLLSNIYLHYVLDEWFIEQIQPRLDGESAIIRFADDFLLLFSSKRDAERVMQVLPKRLGKFGLSLHPDKTRLIELDNRGGSRPDTFDFLGFTHYMGTSRKGKRILKRKTSKKKLKASLQRMNQWMKANRHKPVEQFIYELNQKLRGHYGYYGITFNSRRLNTYYECTKRMLHKWLNRRGGKRHWRWEDIAVPTQTRIPLETPRIVHKCF